MAVRFVRVIVAPVVLIAFVIVASITVAGDDHPSLRLPTSESPSPALLSEYSTLGRPVPASKASEVEELVQQFTDVSPENPIAKSLFENAQPVPLTESSKEAWIVPAGEEICTFIPDSVDGYGAGCVSPDDVRLGRGITMLAGGMKTIVVALVPDGAATPSQSSGDTTRFWSRYGNAATVVVPTGVDVRPDLEVPGIAER